MSNGILRSSHIQITLSTNEPVDRLVKKLVAVCSNAKIANDDPLDDYLEVHAAASKAIDTGGEAFLKFAETRVAKWRPGKKICGQVLGTEICLIATAQWISIVFQTQVSEALGNSVVEKILGQVGGEAMIQLHPFPSMEVLEEGLQMDSRRLKNSDDTSER